MAKRKYAKSADPNHEGHSNPVNRPIKVPFAEFRFVRIELDEPEKTEFRAMLSAGEYDGLDVSDILVEGYKLSISHDPTHSTFVASFTGQYKNMPNSGLVLTGRGSTASIALAVLVHKHSYVCGDEFWSVVESGRGGSYSDIG